MEPTYARREDVVATDLDGGVSLFDGSDTALVLNDTASAVWHELARPCTAAELSDRLATRYTTPDGGRAAIAQQVRALLHDLVERGVVTVLP